MLGENLCGNLTVVNFTSIKCTVPPSSSMSLIRVTVTVIDGLNLATASQQFTYNTTNTPTIYAIDPTFVTMRGGLLNISGTGFGNDDVSVYIDTSSARVLGSSNNYILVNLSALPPGLYPITVRTSMGFAGPLFHIEYRFYVQEVSPQIGSAYGGTDVYVQGAGFENGTRIQFRHRNNRLFPCNIVSIQSNQIHCQTVSTTGQVTITSNGIHPTYGFGYAWFPSRETVQQGTVVTWYWSSVELRSPVYYKIQQVTNAYSTEPVPNGFDSGSATSSGSFSYQFDAVGTFYYWAPNIDQSSGYSMRGVIDVVALEPEIMTVETIWNKFTGVGIIYSSLTITSEAFLSTIVPQVSSIYGGAILMIIGHGFSSNISQIQITIGSNLCPVVQAMDSQIQCIIPARGNSSDAAAIRIISHQVSFPSSFTLNYNETITPSITSVSPTFGNTSQVLVITGNNFVGNGQTNVTVGNTPCIVSNYSIGSITCTVGLNLPAGHHTVTVHVDEIGNSNSDIFYMHDLSVTNATPSEGGYGGGLPVTILGYGFNGTDVTVNICNQSCLLVQIVSNVQLICVTPEVSMAEVNSSCNLTVTVNGISKNTLFTYKANLTAIVTSVSPTRGGTGGGTRITINGNNFPTSANVVTVTIADSPCSLQTVTTTSITCETGSYQYRSVRAQVKVFIDGSGYAISSVEFQYIDLWSSPWTWGGNEPPEAGTLVVIDNYVTIYLDIETPILKVLVIDNATLIFDDSQDVALNVEYIVIVNSGHLQVGTESNPFQHRGIITMYGHLRSIELPIFGAKVLALREGTVDMHGMSTIQTWTQLGATANNGSTVITLLQPIDWNVNSQIVIATTSDRFSQKENEIRRIVNISSDRLTLTLDTPLKYTHLGATQTLNSTTIEIRGEVGLLSHNVVFQGSITETWDETIEECPAGFNPVAGSTHYGYWYRLSNKTEGLSVLINPNYCPNRQPFGRFYNNTVHSTGRFGVWIYPEYAPTITGDCSDTQPSQAVFEGLISWKNNKGIELVMTRTTQIKNAIVFDNADIGIAYITAVGHQETNPPYLRATFYDIDSGSSVIDSIIIGDVGISSTPIVPSTAGLVVMWDRGLRVHNVTFINFPSNETRAIFGPIILGRCTDRCGGWLTKFSNISFINVSIRGKFRWEYDALYHDEDGTLGGQSDSIIMAPDGIINASSTCTLVPNFENAIQCPLSEGICLVENPSTANTSIDIEISFRVYICPCYNCGCPTTTTTTATTATTTTETTTTTTSATTTTTTSATTTTTTSATTTTTTSATTTTTTSATTTTATTTTTTTATTNTETTTTSTIYLPPVQPVDELPSSPQLCQALDVRYWSVDSHWTFGPQDYANWFGAKPGSDKNIFVPRCIWLVIDCPLPTIRSLKIEGVVEFQQGGSHVMYADSIFINGGRLIVGLPNAPFNGSVDIILRNTGPVTIQLPWNFPVKESQTIGVLGGLDLHGMSRGITWTRLAVTAMSSQNVIILSERVNWTVNDEIIITTTDTSISHTERHRIINIENATVIHTQVPLAYTHLVIQHTLANGQTISVAAAVGLLTRNVRIINQYPGSSLSGFRILVTDYRTDVLHIYSNTMYNAYYKGYARLSNTQFIGYGQLADGYNSDQRSGIYMYHLGDYNPNRPSFIDACSFDGGFNAGIGIRSTNGILMTNNVIYNTYRSGIVVTGMNNIIQNNLVTTVYWVGTGQDPSVAQFSSNYDGAIMARDATSMRLRNNLVAGVERLAYRIPGESCGGQDIYIPPNIINEYSNNEAHSAMSGVNLWPSDKGFTYDRIVGSITREDCEDRINPNSINIRLSQIAIPGVSANSSSGNAGGRSGIVFPTISRNNYMPIRSWTGIGTYPCLNGLMFITNTTLAFFNDTCGRHDVAIQASQSNDDGQFPIATSSIRIRRQTSSVLLPIKLQIELRDEPRTSSIASTGIRAEILSNIASTIINRYQAGELQVAWRNLNVTNGSFPSDLSAQEPFDNSSVELSIINQLLLVSPPRDCRQQSPCTFQPVLVAYDVAGNVIQKLGSNERPWQVKATVVGRPNLNLPGGIANYSDGQTQYILFTLPDIGTQQVQFTLIQPDGVNSSFLATTNLTVQAASVSVTQAVLAGQQVNNVYVVNVNETFSIAAMPVDNVTRLRLGQIQWGSWRWSANVTLFSLPKFNRHGSLVKNNSSRTNIDLVAGTVTVTNLAINATGMYVLQIRLVSSNNEHIIALPTNGILVKENSDNFITEIDAISSNFTFAGDFDALNASGELEIIRAMIYNYLISVDMPLISDIILMKGSVGAIVQVDSENTNISKAVTSMLSDPNAIPGLNLIMLHINGRLYSLSSSSSNNLASNDDNSNKIALIVGLVVGLVVGLLLLIGLVWGYNARERILTRHRLGVETTERFRINEPIDVRVPPQAIEDFADFLTSDGVKIEYTVHMTDIGAIIERQRILQNLPQSSPNTNDFAYDKYHTIEDIHAWIDQIVATYPDMVTSFTVGKSYENRDMKGFKISSKKMATRHDGTKATTKKAVWWDGEWISPATVIYIAYALLSKYGQDPTITHLVDQFDYYILPVFNVDGYAYTWTKDRLWRKTRSKTSVPLCYGADPNRNWDYHWCESGASHDPCSDTFCGEKAFSEIETAQVAKFIADHQDTIVHYINFHSYSQLWMSPWAYTTMKPSQFKIQDDGSIQAINALAAVHGTQYQHGNIAQTIYVASGSTVDWIYGTANVIFSYGVELRDTGKYGFLLPEDQIIPSGEETLAGLLALLQYIEKQVYA
ncbi:unnamed protein product [Rotaria sordida]|uniref:Fibrocystin-L n=3 Tax=Rotaria sordida TaxID=392033 RepID=A0A815HFD5_9BILA|nr:unnamed protein product [Rotaria sordida]